MHKRYFWADARGACGLAASAALALALVLGPGQARAAEPTQAPVLPVVMALTTPVRTLEARSAQGEADAQYALAILKARGLRGVVRDEAGAEILRSAALAPRPSKAITTYIAGLNGASGRVSTIMVPDAGLSGAVARRSDACVEALTGVSPSAQQAACGAPGATLRGLWLKAQPWGAHALPSCGREDRRCLALRERVARLNARDPAAEAVAAAERGDFRLGGTNHIGPMPTGWSLPGVECRTWSREMIGKWHVNQDVVMPGDAEHSGASLDFIAAYNRAMIASPAFAYPDVCFEEGGALPAAYAGPVRTAAEAARSRDRARLKALPADVDVDARDPLGETALGWAMANGDEAVARALVERGADPNLRSLDGPAPLALAIERGQTGLAALMTAKGARMTGFTGLCAFEPFGGEPTTVRGCTWAGLLARKRDFDRLDAEGAAGRLHLARPGETMLDGMDEVHLALKAALKADDREAIERLLPHAGQDDWRIAAVFEELRAAGRKDLSLAYAAGRGAELARSPAEAELWRAAGAGRKAGALDLLRDYGADLNLLPAAELAGCRTAARKGDEARLRACVEAAAARRGRIEAAVSAGDAAGFEALVAEAADLRERGKPTLLWLASVNGSAAMVQSLVGRGAREARAGETSAPSLYAGEHRPSATPRPGAAYGGEAADMIPAIARAALRGDAATVRLLAETGAGSPENALQVLGNLGNPPPGLSRTLLDADVDTAFLPAGPAPDRLAAMSVLAAETVRLRGGQALDDVFAGAVYSGYDDVLKMLIAAGYQPAKATEPGRVWFNWAGLGNPCKPSTGRLLVASGLPMTYPPTASSAWSPLHTLAAGCMNPRSVPVLLEAGYDVNLLDDAGRTAVDQAIAYRRAALVTALRAAGGRTARELDAKAVVRRAEVRAETLDEDLSQWVEEGA